MAWSLDSLRSTATLRTWQFPSHAPIVGPLIAVFRKAIFSIASKWALQYVVQQQTVFNHEVVKALSSLESGLQYTERMWMDAERTGLQLRRDLAEVTLAHRRDQDALLERIDKLASADELSGLTERVVALASLASRVDELPALTERVNELPAVGTRIGNLESLVAETRNQVAGVERDINDVITVLLNAVKERREPHALAARAPSNHDVLSPPHLDVGAKLNYFLFEMRYRGSPKEIARRHEKYLPYFQTKSTVVDLGCGRGEFLELLLQNGINARGVDLESDMVDYCQQRSLPVELGDAIAFLESFEDNSLGGIFLGQVVEHLPPDTLIALIQIAHQKLSPDACIVAETINPTCLLALTTHYLMDWSHVHPVHPETLSFVLQSAGFDKPTVLYSEPVPDAVRLKRFADVEGLSEVERQWLSVLNENVDRLNDFLYGNQDYSIVARKIAWPKRLASVAARRALISTL